MVWLTVGRLNPTCIEQSATTAPTTADLESNIVDMLNTLERRLILDPDSSGVVTPEAVAGAVPSRSRDSSARLRRTLIRRQHCRSCSDEPFSLNTVLLVLDDVWDEELIAKLDNIPAAFLLTSRNARILDRATGHVDKVGAVALLFAGGSSSCTVIIRQLCGLF